jgi:S-DNA-T family DNA segregation ATPase FtsK/SpoIIIE
MSTHTLVGTPDPDRDGAPGSEVQPYVVPGEVVPADQARPGPARRAGAVARRQTVHVITTARVAATHPRTKAVAKGTGRNLWYPVAGALVVATRWRDAHGANRYERMMRAAELAGDRDAVLEWEARDTAEKQARHQRVMDWVTSPLELVKAIAIGITAITGLLLGLGVVLAVADGDVSRVLGPITGVIEAIAFTAWFLAAYGALLLTGATTGVVAYLWALGRRRADRTPGWLATSADGDVDATIDETTIAAALAALRITQISQYLKQGMPLQFLTPARVDGRGTHAVIRLPAGVTAERIAKRRADLATGLHRLAKEVWPTTGAEAGILDLWVADKGALAEGAGPYPLLEDGSVDVFKGVPFGKTLRGTPLTAPVMERNTLTGGMPGQGKSSAARVIMAGTALDPTAELRIWVPDANFDFEAFRPRCSRYVMGAEDERISEILDDLRELHAEVQARGELLVRYEIPAVTREYASKGVGLHPLVCLLEEAHVAIQHPTYGAEIAKLLVDIVRLGRKRGIHMLVSTQAPTKDSMPRDVTRNCSNGVAFAVGDHVANDALLGQGAYTAGHRATELIPGTDRGTAVVKGFTGQRSEIVQVYFLSVDKDSGTGDQVTPLITRALDTISRRGKGLPGASTRPAVPESRDLLEDLDAVLGHQPVPAADVPALLAAHAPGWQPYKSLTGKALRARLADEYGVKVPSTGNRWPVDPITVREALARAATADLEDEDLADG